MSQPGPAIRCQTVIDPNDPSNAVTLAVCILAMLISLTFTWRYWAAWLATTGLSQPSSTIPSQSTNNQILSRGNSSHSGSTHGTARRSLQSIVRDPTSIKSKLGQLRSLKRVPLLLTLLLVTWIIYTFDQLMMLLLAIALIFTCPQYNCKEDILYIEPTSCTFYSYFRALIYLQTLGSCTFVLCVLYRFISAFALISRERSAVLRVTSALVIVVTFYRLVGVTLRNIQVSTGWPAGNAETAFVKWINGSSYRAFYIMLGVSCIGGLSLGLQYVKRVREQAQEASISPLHMPTLPSSHSADKSASHGMPASASESLRSSIASSTATMFNARIVHATEKKHSKHIQDRITQSRWVVFWILVALGTVVAFAVIMLSSLSDGFPQLLLNACMSLFLKAFSGSVCLSITSMTRLVSSGASLSGSGAGMSVGTVE